MARSVGVARGVALASFAMRLFAELTRAMRTKVGCDYEPTSFLAREGEKGVFAKGVKLKDRVSIVGIRSEGGTTTLTATVPSSRRGVQYEVKLMLPLDFKCSCDWSRHRFYPCKHVYATVLKVLEAAGLELRKPDAHTKYALYYAIYDSLNRLAYRKSKSRKSSRKSKPS
jgi:uncharacterized Zn finger protein